MTTILVGFRRVSDRMSVNDQLILKRILEQNKAKVAPSLSESDFFELTVMEQVLKDFDLANEEIDLGITDGGDDGGIDGMYTFINGQVFSEGDDLSMYKKGNLSIDVFVIQVKKSDGFESTALDKLIVTSNDIFDLSKSLSDLQSFYNSRLIQRVKDFRIIQDELITKFPKLRISYIYASIGDTQQIHPNVIKKSKDLKIIMIKHFSNSEYNFSFLGAKELLGLIRTLPSTSLTINMLEYIATAKKAYICLVNLRDYYQFIIDENNNLRKHIFESNVRDYQGKTLGVNQDIQNTLLSAHPEDFWWLNNGITILAADAGIIAKTITLEDPQIVNGLQTSTEIYEYFKANPKTQDSRTLLVRIIETNEAISRDRIIRATNSQTTIPVASLRATDKVQRDIEDFFRSHDLYYDRRKNFYKNQGQQREKIISISYLAQSTAAILLREPNEARARPSSILTKEVNYKKIFNQSYHMDLYHNCVKIMKIAEKYLKSSKAVASINEKSNLKFHFAMYITLSVFKKTDYTAKDIIALDFARIDESLLADCWAKLIDAFHHSLQPSNNPDAIAKSREFVQVLLNDFPKSTFKKL